MLNENKEYEFLNKIDKLSTTVDCIDFSTDSYYMLYKNDDDA